MPTPGRLQLAATDCTWNIVVSAFDVLLGCEKHRHQGVRMPMSHFVLGFEAIDEFHVLERAQLL